MNSSFDQLNQVRSFDVVFVGHLASVTASLFGAATNYQYKSLLLKTQIKVIEPSLLPVFSEQIRVTKIIKKQNIYQKDNKIVSIKPIPKQIQLQGGKIYDYKYLVYTENTEEWLDYESINTLQQSLSNEYSLVYSNVKKRDLTAIYKKSSGNIIFYVPNGRHNGYDNFNFLYVFKKFQQSLSNSSTVEKQLQFKVILEGKYLFPYCKQADSFMKKELEQRGIQIIFDSKLTKIDYLRRTLTLNSHSQIAYTVLYCIVPQKIPQLLKNAEIDPYNNNSNDLTNNQFKNIFIFGADIFPTTHTFDSVQYQNRVIVKNLEHFLTKSSLISFYSGISQIPIYLDCKQIVYITHCYKSKSGVAKTEQQEISMKQKCSFALFYLNKLTRFYLTELYYNYGSSGSPYYIFSPTLSSLKYTEYQSGDRSLPMLHCENQENVHPSDYEINLTMEMPKKAKTGR